MVCMVCMVCLVCMYVCTYSVGSDRAPAGALRADARRYHAASLPLLPSLPHPRMVPPPWAAHGRPRRSGAARRAQALRAHARAAQKLIQGFAALHHHRGCQPTALGAALAVALVRQAAPPPRASPTRAGAATDAPTFAPAPAPPPRADAAPLGGAAAPAAARDAGSSAGAPSLGAAASTAPAPRRAADAPTATSTPAPPPRADAAPLGGAAAPDAARDAGGPSGASTPGAAASPAPAPRRAADAPAATSSPAPPPRADRPLGGATAPDAAHDAGSPAGVPTLGAAAPPAPTPRRAADTPSTTSSPAPPPRADAAPLGGAAAPSAPSAPLHAAELALHDALQCVTLEPSRPEGYCGLAAALLKLERWEEAEDACMTGIKVAGDSFSDDLADAFLLLLDEAERGRGPRVLPPDALPPREGR
jgi:hypothetical protein